MGDLFYALLGCWRMIVVDFQLESVLRLLWLVKRQGLFLEGARLNTSLLAHFLVLEVELAELQSVDHLLLGLSRVNLRQKVLKHHLDGVFTNSLTLLEFTHVGLKLWAQVFTVLVFTFTVCHGNVSIVVVRVLPKLTNEGLPFEVKFFFAPILSDDVLYLLGFYQFL